MGRSPPQGAPLALGFSPRPTHTSHTQIVFSPNLFGPLTSIPKEQLENTNQKDIGRLYRALFGRKFCSTRPPI
jgi:hypothetical protein